MPNWCYTNITICHNDKNKLKDFFDKVGLIRQTISTPILLVGLETLLVTLVLQNGK